MSKLTIPAPQNLKRREAFLFAHPDYYSEIKLRAELLKIYLKRKANNLRWKQPQSPILEKTSELVPVKVEKKQSAFKKVFTMFKSQRGQ